MSEIVIASFGDLLINRETPLSAFQHLTPLFTAADVIIGNYEGVLTDTPQPIADRRGATLSSSVNAQGLGAFSVLSLANNHSLDSGIDGLKDTLAAIANIGVQTTGAGLSYQEAWRPAYIDCKGVRIAVFGVTGVFRAGTEANAWQGGAAAIRSRDYYAAPFNGAIEPGALPDVHTLINEIAAELVKKAPFTRVLPHSEFDLIRAAQLREYWDIPGQSVASACAYRDKGLIKEYLRKADVEVAPFQRPGSWFLVPGSWFLVPGSWFLVRYSGLLRTARFSGGHQTCRRL